MYHYTRPSFNTVLMMSGTDGKLPGSFRHKLDPDDVRLATRTAKDKIDPNKKERGKPDPALTTQAPTRGQTKGQTIGKKKTGKKRARRKKK